jgi:hypothetical protein
MSALAFEVFGAEELFLLGADFVDFGEEFFLTFDDAGFRDTSFAARAAVPVAMLILLFHFLDCP